MCAGYWAYAKFLSGRHLGTYPVTRTSEITVGAVKVTTSRSGIREVGPIKLSEDMNRLSATLTARYGLLGERGRIDYEVSLVSEDGIELWRRSGCLDVSRSDKDSKKAVSAKANLQLFDIQTRGNFFFRCSLISAEAVNFEADLALRRNVMKLDPSVFLASGGVALLGGILTGLARKLAKPGDEAAAGL